MSKSSTRQNVKVVARVRPTNQKEVAMGGVTCVKHTKTNIEVIVEGNPNAFNFDRIFGAESTQEEVFQETAKPLIEDVLAGYNATIFAYGQTGTGKTHTMEGDITSESGKGIIPRAVDALFDGVSQADENLEFTFKVTYVEIYLERIRDLMDEHRLKNNLAIREDKIKGVYIAGVTEVYVASAEELLQVMHMGAANRATAATGMNEGSSRSHSMFTITVEQRDITTNAAKSGKLVLVDLAGSEMVKKTNASGQQLEEAKTINKSLSALGQVIYALTDEKSSHVPYRDSKLTRVLQDSLGGNSKTVLIVAVSPSSFNAPETVSTLRFGTRAKSIENKVTINQTRTVEELEALLVRAEKAIDAQTAHIIALTTQLQHMSETQHQVIYTTASHDGTEGAAQSSAGETGAGDGSMVNVNMEGKVLIDAAQYEAEAKALRQLQETVLALSQELDDEKLDSQRKDLELNQMSQLLSDKERLIQEAITMVDEVKKSNDALRERSEQLLKEKIAAQGELQSLQAGQDELQGKLKFDIMEMEVRVNTLEAENQALKEEIAELGGDSGAPAPGGPSGKQKDRKKSVINSNSANDPEEELGGIVRRMQNTRKSYDGAEEGGKGMSYNERKALLDQFSESFAALCLQRNLPDALSAELFALFDSYASAVEVGVGAVEEKFGVEVKGLQKRVKDLEEQRSRLEKDLQSRIENMTHLQQKFDSLSRMDSKHLAELLNEREMARTKSLQTRLEQLVAVHRQLLRKFASLELEASELKKKTMLRDERIRQLESNSKTLVGNIRQQAERHVAELANVKDSIQTLKAEYEHRLEDFQRMQEENYASQSPASKGGNIKVVVKPKSLRGGGGGGRSFYQESPRTMASMMDAHNEIGFFTGSSNNLTAGLPPPPYKK
eukprot:gene22952-27931_t